MLQEIKINEIGSILFNLLKVENFVEFKQIVNLEKGIEVGSKNYINNFSKNLINYFRVGDLIKNKNEIFINKNIKHKNVYFDDILLALDGSPGRIGIGFEGAYSSGIYKVISNDNIKGFIYFYLCSNMCQNVIKEFSIGTTILHASKSINELFIPYNNEINFYSYNMLFKKLIDIKRKIANLTNIKNLLLEKYF